MSDEPKKAPHEYLASAFGLGLTLWFIWYIGLSGVASVVGTIAVFVGGWYIINKMID